MLSSDWQHAVHGFRTVERVQEGPEVAAITEVSAEASAHRIRIRDFNPYMIARGRAEILADEAEHAEGNEATSGNEDGRETTAPRTQEGTRNDGQSRVRFVTEPSVIAAGSAFAETITSHLPYREVVTDVPVEVSDVMLDDSRILCLKVQSSLA